MVRRRLHARILVVAFLVSLAAGLGSLGAVAGAAEVGVNVAATSGDFFHSAKVIAALRESRPAWVRVFAGWNGLEPSRGVYNTAEIAAYAHFFDQLPAGARYASVSVSSPDGQNGLTLDDTGYAVLVQHKAAQVLLVSDGNQFLEKVLTLLPNVDLYRIASSRYLAVEADRFDIIVFDGYLPPLLPSGNLLVVNPPDRGPYPSTGAISRPTVTSWDREDPILSFVDLQDLKITRASKIDAPRWAKTLITSGDGSPLMLAGQDGDRRVAILPFDLQQTNLWTIPAFPILMSNLVNYLSPPGVVQSSEVQTGAPESLSPLPQVQTVRVTSPSDQVTAFPTGQGPITYATTDVPGLYHVQQIVQGGQQTVDEDLFAANLTNPDASDLRPRLSGLDNPAPTDAGFATLQKEFWGVLAALVLPLLMFEWYWFHRRT